MPALIDTNIAIHLRDADEPFVSWAEKTTSDLAISVITVIELQAGLFSNPTLARNRLQGHLNLLSFVTILSLDMAVADAYGRIVAHAGFSRPRLLDRLIAATAIVHDVPLITLNIADFRDVPALQLQPWPAPAQ